MDKSTFTREYTAMRHLLRDARRRAGLTQVQLAAKLGETQSFVSKCERGERRLDLVELRVFCRAIGVRLAEFSSALEAHLSGKRRS
jgi:ribosome-binding protein aMBF1 (putative translation factor)